MVANVATDAPTQGLGAFSIATGQLTASVDGGSGTLKAGFPKIDPNPPVISGWTAVPAGLLALQGKFFYKRTVTVNIVWQYNP